MFNIWVYFGIIVLFFGFLDAYKYKILSNKIKKYKTSKGQSRIFANIAILHKFFLAIWAIYFLKDYVVATSTLLALYTSIDLWVQIYKFYPFQGRGRFGYQRPSFFKYLWNSLLPNKIAGKI